MFKSITIKNYKNIKELNNFPLRNINVLIGANGSGKSNFLQVFNFIKQACWYGEGALSSSHGLDVAQFMQYVKKRGGAKQFLSYRGRFGDIIFCQFDWLPSEQDIIKSACKELINTHSLSQNQADLLYDYFLENNYGQWLAIRFEKNNFDNFDSFFDILFNSITPSGLSKILQKPENNIKLSEIMADVFLIITFHYYQQVQQYHFHNTTAESSPIVSTAPLHENKRLWSDGGNIAPFIYRLYKEFPKEYEFLVCSIRILVPDFYNFYIEPDKQDTDYVALYWLNVNDLGSDNRPTYHPTELSDGSLRIICLLTVLLQPAELMPKVIIIDEPELGLHPQAMNMIVGIIKDLSEDRQFVIATQSPEFLDLFAPEDVVVVDKNQDGTSGFMRLEPDQLEGWIKTYSLSQLWKKNIIGGQP